MRTRHNKRDGNELRLIEHACRLGAQWQEEGPLDGWITFRGQWMPVEIKLPEREGLKYEYTPRQKRFFSFCNLHGAKWLTWRTESDVERDLGARRAA